VENQVLVVVLKQDLGSFEITEIMKQIEGHPKVLQVKTLERLMADALQVEKETT
jgi:hypothetical protein